MRLFFVVAASLVLAGCAATPIKITDFGSTTAVDQPAPGVVTTRGIGETMVAKGTRTVSPALEVMQETQFNKKDGEKSIMTCAVTAIAGTYVKRGTYSKDPVGAECFGPAQFRVTNSDGSTNWNCPGQLVAADICHVRDDVYFIAHLGQKIYLKQDFDKLRRIDKGVPGKTNFVQELLYNGRSGDTIRLTYREFAEDLTRPTTTQELQYDLAASPVVGFRNVRLEVLEANNTEVQFRLDQTF